MQDHDCATMDKETDLAAKLLECALLKIIKQIEEHGAVELDVVVGLHRADNEGEQGKGKIRTAHF